MDVLTKITYRKIHRKEEKQVCQFVINIFNEFVAHEYSEEGISTFLKSSEVDQLRKRLDRGDLLLIAEGQGKIIGVIEVRNNNHISRFFVEGKYQRHGIGRELLRRALREFRQPDTSLTRISVNSSPNSVSAYERFGFRVMDEEKLGDGIRYIPMRLELDTSIEHNLALSADS